MSIDGQKELKDCPFCGAQPRLTKSGTEMPYMTSLVRCQCGVTFGDVGHDVASKWNTRKVCTREQTLVTWVKTSEQLPEPYRIVLVDYGIAFWTGTEWLSASGDDSGRPIKWSVLYWSPLIAPPISYESARTQQVMGDGSATIAPMSDASAPITPATQQPDVTRPCTCPAGNEPQPCMRKFAVSDCAAAYRELQLVTVLKQAREAFSLAYTPLPEDRQTIIAARIAIDNELKRLGVV